MPDARAIHAAEFLARLPHLTDRDVAALMDRLAGPDLPDVLAEYTRTIIDEVGAMLPEDTRAGILNEVGSLMLIGYLVGRSQEEVPPSAPPSARA
ncbi:hypothetical protein [Myxococcus sp. AS-1-15]|uniref:hypothetical protein n=1 Tax=Myxococcus sp. AS-1-15 TaxID=2874600 RepID=UPI001CBC25C3|nr:hypothetical protein [Myxococcus sp. AS-1-15]MBZ4402020.1 hypothetical protein [Myxococcus sp. AS-1-15]